ncbi:MAG: glycosyltransferase family 2 protein [Pikeienuella sp.]
MTVHPLIQQNRDRSTIGRVALFCTMRNEGPYILEWVAHHIAVGFTDIVVAYNDSTDGTVRLLMELDRIGAITAIDNNRWRGAPQAAAYRKAMKTEAAQEAEWIMVLDADEMLNFKVGEGDLNSFMGAVEPANLYSFNWRMFGHSGHNQFRNTTMADRFRRCGPNSAYRAQAGVKTIFRNIFSDISVGPHRPRWKIDTPEEAYRWLDGSGLPVEQGLIHNGWRNHIGGFELAQVNHYAVRDNESFLMKLARGRAANNRHGLNLKYWYRMSMNAYSDDSIDRTLPARQAALAALREERELRAGHRGAITDHRTRIAEMREEPPLAELYQELCAVRLRRPRVT